MFAPRDGTPEATAEGVSEATSRKSRDGRFVIGWPDDVAVKWVEAIEGLLGRGGGGISGGSFLEGRGATTREGHGAFAGGGKAGGSVREAFAAVDGR